MVPGGVSGDIEAVVSGNMAVGSKGRREGEKGEIKILESALVKLEHN